MMIDEVKVITHFLRNIIIDAKWTRPRQHDRGFFTRHRRWNTTKKNTHTKKTGFSLRDLSRWKCFKYRRFSANNYELKKSCILVNWNSQPHHFLNCFVSVLTCWRKSRHVNTPSPSVTHRACCIGWINRSIVLTIPRNFFFFVRYSCFAFCFWIQLAFVPSYWFVQSVYRT